MANKHPMQDRLGGGTPPADPKPAVAPDEQSEREERAAARAQQAVEGKYPAGAEAIAGLDDDAKVKVVNLSLKPFTYPLYGGKKGQHRSEQTIPPLGSAEVTAKKAREWMRPDVRRPQHIYVAPAEGDCRGAIKFKAFGREWATCPFANCPRHPAPLPGFAPSVWMTQHLIAKLETEPAIRRVAEQFDTREDVVRWAFHITNVRQQRRLQRQGLVGTGDVGGREKRQQRSVF